MEIQEISGRKTIGKLREGNIFPQEFVYTAPLLIICCYDKSAYPERGERGEDKAYADKQLIRATSDLSIASSFIILRATELGLGTCYVAWMDNQNQEDVQVS